MPGVDPTQEILYEGGWSHSESEVSLEDTLMACGYPASEACCMCTSNIIDLFMICHARLYPETTLRPRVYLTFFLTHTSIHRHHLV